MGYTLGNMAHGASAAVEIQEVLSGRGPAARQFIQLPFRLYRFTPQWVPQFRRDMKAVLDRKNPFFARSTAAFYLASRGGRPVGTIAAIDNVPYNQHYAARTGLFYFFECEDDPEAAGALFQAALGWMRARGLTDAMGPAGFGMLGSGLLVDGFQHRAAMTMMPYNHAYYPALVEAAGFRKWKDQYSARIDASSFTLPDKVRRVAEIALDRGAFTVPEFRKKKELARHAAEIGRVYNESFSTHVDAFVPLTDPEIRQLTGELLMVADPGLIKVLFYHGEMAGFLFGFPDLSAALRRSGGRVTPWAILDILLEYRRTRTLIVNGAAVLPRFQRLGGNALLYWALEKIAKQKRFDIAESVQVAETTELMLSDLQTLGMKNCKTHRMYRREL
jgi:hypothetical protein